MFSTIALALTLITAQAASAPLAAKAPKSPWISHIVSAEWIKPGTEYEPEAGQGKMALKVIIKFEYKGPEGEVSAPVLKVTDGTGKEYIMLGNIKTEGDLSMDCVHWLMSASYVGMGKKPETLAFKNIAGCSKDALSFYFLLPEKPKPPLALIFADAAPIPLRPK
jgi:hypothetical protein